MAKLQTPDSDSDDNASSPSSSSSSEAAVETTAKGGGASEYERQRQSRIAENKARLAALGLPNMASSLKGFSSSKNRKKGKEKKKVKDDDEEYRPDDDGEGEPNSDSSSEDDELDKDEDFVVGNSSGSRKRKQVKNKSSKMKGKVSGKKRCGSNSEYIDDDDDEALRKAIALSLQDAAEGSSEKNVMNITKAEKKGNIHIQEDKGKKKNKKSFASRLQLTEDEVIVHFFQLDEAGKGAVTMRDLQRAAIAHDFTWTDKELVDMIRCFDSDGDGKLSLDDFRKIIVRCNMIKGS